MKIVNIPESAALADSYLNLKRMVVNMIKVGHINEAVGTLANFFFLDEDAMKRFLLEIKPDLTEDEFKTYDSAVLALIGD